jgi:tRNA(fMet)-specific endonuclease VapC
MVILDSTILIDFLRGKENAKQKIAELKKRGADFYTTQVNVFELVQGVYAHGKDIEEELMALNLLLQDIKLLDLTFVSSYTAGRLSGELMRTGKIISMGDLLIAGISTANNVKTIITKNEKDFKKIKEIKVESY